MFAHIGKFLNKRYPFGMSLVKFALAFQMFKRFMITMNYKLFWKKVVLPILQSPNKSIKLFVPGGVIEMTPFKFLTKISYRVTLLKKDNPNVYVRGITLNLKSFSKVREC